MKIIKRGNEKIYSLPTKEISHEKVKAANSGLAREILKVLYGKASYPFEIARLLGVHEQKIYYHVRKLEKAGFIKKAKQEVKQGVLVNYYALANDSFFIKFGEFKQSQKSHFSAQGNNFFFPFSKRIKHTMDFCMKRNCMNFIIWSVALLMVLDHIYYSGAIGIF